MAYTRVYSRNAYGNIFGDTDKCKYASQLSEAFQVVSVNVLVCVCLKGAVPVVLWSLKCQI